MWAGVISGRPISSTTVMSKVAILAMCCELIGMRNFSAAFSFHERRFHMSYVVGRRLRQVGFEDRAHAGSKGLVVNVQASLVD